MKSPQEVAAIIRRLKELYPDAACSLDYGKDYELLFSVRLAAQCTDARVNQVTPALFARFPTLEAFAAASPEEVGEYVRSCGFWRAKARDIVASAQMLLSDFGGRVPDNMDVSPGRSHLTIVTFAFSERIGRKSGAVLIAISSSLVTPIYMGKSVENQFRCRC